LREAGPAAIRFDRRRKESRLFEETRQALVQYCNNEPTFAQLAQIDGICRLTLLVAQLDPTGADSDRRLLALNDALQRSYKALGAAPAPKRRKATLAETLAQS
jgi:hypothetical protein